MGLGDLGDVLGREQPAFRDQQGLFRAEPGTGSALQSVNFFIDLVYFVPKLSKGDTFSCSDVL